MCRSTSGVLVAGCSLVVAACVPRPSPLVPSLQPLPVFAAESLSVDTIAPGLVHRSYWAARGPWAIQVLDVDRAACWSLVALKAGGQAVGRERTSDLVRAYADSLGDSTGTQQPARSGAAASRALVGGGVNADFFTFTPPGVPIGPHVSAGRVIAGPWTRPALALGSDGAPFIGTFTARGFAVVGSDSFLVTAWNQRRLPGLALFDRAWGAVTDSATGAVEVVVTRTDGGRASPVGARSAESTGDVVSVGTVAVVDTLTPGVAVPDDGIVLVLGKEAPAELRRALAAVRPATAVRWAVRLEPFLPSEAVGGFPILLRDSASAADLDSAGGAAFGPVRHPRTAVGVAAGGRRLLLVVVDGRQQPYSDGMTLRELAAFFLALGVPAAINLDGGGSTTMVVRDRGGVPQIVNRPSDAAGERPVANALAVVGGCR
jgi:hypothetical protein